MGRQDGYIPRATKDVCNEILRVRGVITHSDQLGAQQKAMLEDQMDVILSTVSASKQGEDLCPENCVVLTRRSPAEVNEKFAVKMAEFQAQRRVLLEKLLLSRRALSMMVDDDELLTPTGMRSLARTTLNKMNGKDNPEVSDV